MSCPGFFGQFVRCVCAFLHCYERTGSISGKLTASKLDGGGYEIEASELYRVWPAITIEKVTNPNKLGSETPHETNALQGEIDVLRKQIETMGAERERTQLTEIVEDLRTRLDAESAERRALTAQITDQRAKVAEAPKRGLWMRFLS